MKRLISLVLISGALAAVSFEIRGAGSRNSNAATPAQEPKAEQPAAKAHEHYGKPSTKVRRIIARLLSSAAKGESGKVTVSADQIPAKDLKVLNDYAAKVSKRADCKIRSVEGCNSCCNDGKVANLVHTDCGVQCWTCGGDDCH